MNAEFATWFVTCGACNGSCVEVFGVMVHEHGCGVPHRDSDERPCSTCHGEGVVVAEVTPITLEDLAS